MGRDPAVGKLEINTSEVIGMSKDLPVAIFP